MFKGCSDEPFFFFFSNKFKTYEAVLTSTHILSFRSKYKKIVYPCIPQFYYIKVGFKG